MDRWAWERLEPWLEIRRELPTGAVLCVIHGPTAGRRWEASAARKQLHHAAALAGVRRRFAPHQLRHITRISNTPTSASPASTYRASTAARSLAPFTAGHRRRSPPAPGSSSRSSLQRDWGQPSAWPTQEYTRLAISESGSAAEPRPCFHGATCVRLLTSEEKLASRLLLALFDFRGPDALRARRV
jgi:hypothetical protein